MQLFVFPRVTSLGKIPFYEFRKELINFRMLSDDDDDNDNYNYKRMDYKKVNVILILIISIGALVM